MKQSELIFGIMANFNKNEYSISELNYLVSPFGITESCLRTNLSRMIKKGLFQSRHKGKKALYSFSTKGAAIRSNMAAGFRSLDWSDWDQSWWGVLFSIPDSRKKERYPIRRKLVSYRFAPLYPGFWIRPLNRAEKNEIHLKKISLKENCKTISFKYHTGISKEEISGLWKLTAVNESFEKGLAIINKQKRKMSTCSPKEAFIDHMEAGNELVAILSKDPLLPEIYLPEEWKGSELKEAFGWWNEAISDISRPYWQKIFNH